MVIMMIPHFSILVSTALLTGVAADCNPLTQNSCGLVPGLESSSYSVDFTRQTSLPSDWILADAASVTFGSKGAEFNFKKRKDAPYIWTDFYVAYGQIDVELQVANGTGIITSAVMFSDDADEIDWEFSGSNFGSGSSTGKAQTNVFGKGMTGNYDRGTLQDVLLPPQSGFHTYTLNWTPDRIDWIIDGVTKYSTTNNQQTTGNYQFPQTPSRLHLGMWDAGDPDTAGGTRNWAGGYTDYSRTPYIAYVKSVRISTPYPCKSWQYPVGFSGSWKDVKCVNETISKSSSASKTSLSATSTYTSATYSVEAGDNGWSIAEKLGCTFDQLSAANPGVDWDLLAIGQRLVNPNVKGSSSVSSGGSNTSKSTSSDSGSTSSSGTGTGLSSAPSSGVQTSSDTRGSNSPQGNIVVIATTPSAGASASDHIASGTSSGTGSSNSGGAAVATSSITPSSSSSTQSSSQSSTTSGRSKTSPVVPGQVTSSTCTADRCLNGMITAPFASSARVFCSSFNTSSAVATPTYLTGCGGDRSRVASACHCLSRRHSNTAITPSTTALATDPLSSGTPSLETTLSSSSGNVWSNWAGHWSGKKFSGKNKGSGKRNERSYQGQHDHIPQPGRFAGGH